MNVLVTGGLGYIGSHTIVELHKEGHDTVIIDDCSNSDISVLDNIEKITNKKPAFYQKNLCYSRLHDIEKVFEENNIDAVIHFAARKSVGESEQYPIMYYKNNIYSTINLLELMRKYNVTNFIFSSSCTVYGTPDKLPVTEKEKIKPPSSVYGETKQICESIITNLHKQYDYNSVLLRYFNPVGAHESGLIGELPTGESPNNLMPYISRVATKKFSELTIHGNDYNTADGTCIRDYIHVTDLAMAHVSAVTKCEAFRAEPINIGTGRGYSVLDMVNNYQDINNVDIPYKIGPRRSGDIESIYADANYAKKVLGWSAKYNIVDMVKSEWQWINRN